MALINDSAEIRRLLRPLRKRWWFIVCMSCLGAYNGYQSFMTEPPSYQARATIQVNDKDSSPSTFLEHFEAFSMVGEFLLELEFIRSTYLIRQAIRKLPIRVGYWKMENNVWQQKYRDLPFELGYQIKDSSWLDKPFMIEIHENGDWKISVLESEAEETPLRLKATDPAIYPKLEIKLKPAPGKSLPEPGKYQVIIRSEEALMAIFADMDNLLVRLQDEHVALINIYYWHPVPALATDFVNTLAQTYMEDFLERKKEMAGRALGTIEKQIIVADKKLSMAEQALFAYRDKIKIWEVSSFRKLHLDLLTETETRKLNVTLKIQDLENLNGLLDTLRANQEAQLNYQSVRDRGYLDVLDQIEKLQKALIRSRLNLTEEHPKIKAIQRDIAVITKDLKDRVSRTLHTYKEVQEKLNQKAINSSEQILSLPKVEKNLSLLVREVDFRQRFLDSLNIKMIDAYISAMSDFTFHRILEHELAPEEPIKPLFRIKVGVTALMYTLYAIFILLFLQGIKGVLTDAEDIDEHLDMPLRAGAVLAKFPEGPISQGIINLATDVILDQEVQVITLFDFKPHPDKFHSSYQLAYVLAQLNQRTLFLNSAEDHLIPKERYPGHKNLDIMQVGKRENDFPAKVLQHKDWGRTLKALGKQYDYIIYVMQGIKGMQDALTLMKSSDLNLYVAGLYRSKIAHLRKVQEYLYSHEIPNTELILLQKPDERLFTRLRSQVLGTIHRYKDSF